MYQPTPAIDFKPSYVANRTTKGDASNVIGFANAAALKLIQTRRQQFRFAGFKVAQW